MSLDWAAVEALPAHVRAAMQALQLDRPDFNGLDTLGEKEWRSHLEWLDRQQMTLLFGHACAGRLPEGVAERIAANLEANRSRLERLREDYEAIAAALESAAIPHAVLKGFTHGPPYVPSPDLRPQYDLDLLISPDHLARAIEALEGLGFESANERDRAPADHAPPLIRRTGWQWRGDYFDPDIPTVVELHHRLWDSATEGFEIPALALPAFEPAGNASYAAAHALRHLLRGSLKLLHVYEIARLLHHTQALPRADLPQTIVYRLAERWFGCRLPESVQTVVLPAPVRAWLDRYAASPLTREFRPNKDELWLHLELVNGWRSRLRVARRRLAPLALPGALEGHHDRARPPLTERAQRAVRYTGYAGRRLGFHAVSLGRAAAEAARWLRVRRESRA